MTDKDFIDTYNECYPFERYIVKNPKKINYLFDDALLCELFIPSTEIKPIIHDGEFVGHTKVNEDEIYIKLKCKNECDDNWTEFRMAYYDFNDHIREEIRYIIISDFGRYEWECLYVDYEDVDDLEIALEIQKKLIEEKYGVCNIKDDFIKDNTIEILQNLT